MNIIIPDTLLAVYYFPATVFHTLSAVEDVVAVDQKIISVVIDVVKWH